MSEKSIVSKDENTNQTNNLTNAKIEKLTNFFVPTMVHNNNYPLVPKPKTSRTQRKQPSIKKCKCGKNIGYRAKRCRKCYLKNPYRSRYDKPSYEELQEKFTNMSGYEIAKYYGVLPATVYRWRKDYNRQGNPKHRIEYIIDSTNSPI